MKSDQNRAYALSLVLVVSLAAGLATLSGALATWKGKLAPASPVTIRANSDTPEIEAGKARSAGAPQEPHRPSP